MAGPRLNATFAAQQAAMRRQRNAAVFQPVRRIVASDSGTATEGPTAQTWPMSLVVDPLREAAPKTPRQTAEDLGALAGGGYVADVLAQIMGHRTAVGSVIGGCIAVWYVRRERR